MFALAPITTLLLLAVAIPATAQTTRFDALDEKANRTGGVIVDERTGRVDVYDRDANRIGYGQLNRAQNRVDFFDVRGNRVGSATLSPGASAVPKR